MTSHPPGSEFGKQKGRYKKQNDIVKCYVNADCIDLFRVHRAKKYTA